VVCIDLGKTTFRLVALGELKKVLVREEFSRPLTHLQALFFELAIKLFGFLAVQQVSSAIDKCKVLEARIIVRT
jgi:hypothetical protein